MNELQIEQHGVKYAETLGWMVRKASSPGNTGTHDRIHHKAGVTFYIEYKATGKKASAKQRKFAEQLKAAGIPCRCCDRPSKARAFIDAMDTTVELGLLYNIHISAQDISSFNQ